MILYTGIEITIFSVNQRISHKLMEQILAFLSSIPGASRRIVQNTKENLYISATELHDGYSQHSQHAKELAGHASTSKLHSYPNNPSVPQQTITQRLLTHKANLTPSLSLSLRHCRDGQYIPNT